jgi:hypothetical protein
MNSHPEQWEPDLGNLIYQDLFDAAFNEDASSGNIDRYLWKNNGWLYFSRLGMTAQISTTARACGPQIFGY